MGMTIDKAIKVLERHHMWTGEPQEIIDVKVENSAMGVAIDTMRKYQKIEQTYQRSYKLSLFVCGFITGIIFAFILFKTLP